MSQAKQLQQSFQMMSGACIEQAKHIPADKANWQPEGVGRSVHGILDHLSASNFGFSKLIKGENIAGVVDRNTRQDVSMPTESFEAALEQYQASCDVAAKAMEAVQDKQLMEERTLPWGDAANLAIAMTIPSVHTSYHMGQLCYIQTLWGDSEDRL